MTIQEAIERTDELLHNVYSRAEKIAWLSALDLEVKQQILDTCEGAKTGYFAGYDENTPENMTLLVSAPYDEVYLRLLQAQIHYHNGEYDRYNNAVALYRTLLEGFSNDYRRNHMPRCGAFQYF